MQQASLFAASAKPHRLSTFFSLIFRYASVHHPLMASAIARIVEDRENRAAIGRDDSALKQIVSMVLCDSKHVVGATVYSLYSYCDWSHDLVPRVG